eukprot:TRINITY_DN6283_c0_g1_i1.p1 TRINITY_DN6283_c0_g1~~TRINITY_DN6283_c0_g1_i1.p1  ORF type:complete len:343 (+),score=65.55 TRINITY_DN6283_c0_g1_i1:46-1074(+)
MSFSVSEELKNNFGGYKRARYRYFQVVNNDGTLDQGLVQDQASSTSLDFKTIVDHINPDEPAIFLFLEKTVTFNKPWVLILYLPESLDEETITSYKEIGGVLNSELGKVFEKEVHFNNISDITWSNYSTAPNAAKKTVPNWRSNVSTTPSSVRSSPQTTTTTDNTPSWVKNNSNSDSPTRRTFDQNKPWNERELALHNLDVMEEEGRSHLMRVASDKPTGWRENNLPLTSGAISALNSIKNGQVNWIQLNLINNFTEIDCEATKTVNTTNLSSNIDADRTQFYLYDYSGSIVLIHFIPESGSVKEKMVYNTCKAPLSDTIKSNGISVVKKVFYFRIWLIILV